ncbi:hypothetical protein [Lysinibacillus sphaericus]|uniref:hypothetical protein n=1 Tax=Lysinibacillus sphaericus TaxID=1421 RepID=UPI001FAE7DFF|nr:hypothetical protein [Lysinibacillus sphaericus]
MDKVTLDILEVWKKKQKQDYLKFGINTLKPNQLLTNLFSVMSIMNISNPQMDGASTEKI